jgi:hypothetical protein
MDGESGTAEDKREDENRDQDGHFLLLPGTAPSSSPPGNRLNIHDDGLEGIHPISTIRE